MLGRSDDQPLENENVKVKRIAYKEVHLRPWDPHGWQDPHMVATAPKTKKEADPTIIEITSANGPMRTTLDDLGEFYRQCVEELS